MIPAIAPAIAIYTLGKTLGTLTDRLFNKIQETVESQRTAVISAIDETHEKGLSLQIEAGRQVKLAIENFKNAYADSLDLTIEQLSPEIQKTLATINQLADDFLNSKLDSLSDVAIRVDQLVRSLPGFKNYPFISKNIPSFITYSPDKEDILIQFFGHFPKPELTEAAFYIQEQVFYSMSNIKQLSFRVPSQYFYPLSIQDFSKVHLAEGELKLSWIKTSLVKSVPMVSSYKIWIGVLPINPGRVLVEYSRPLIQRDIKSFTSPPFFQTAGKKGKHLTTLNKQYSISPEEGWQIVRGSSNFHVIEKRPNNSTWSFVRDDEGKVVYTVSTIHVSKRGDSGKINFQIQFDQYKETITEHIVQEEIPLKWRETRVIDDKKGTFRKIIFTAFDGTHYEMAGVNSSNPFIKITNQGGKLVLNAASSETLSVFSSSLQPKL